MIKTTLDMDQKQPEASPVAAASGNTAPLDESSDSDSEDLDYVYESVSDSDASSGDDEDFQILMMKWIRK